jgi:hypothetical protein
MTMSRMRIQFLSRTFLSFIIILFTLVLASGVSGQEKNLAERLGFPPDAKLLIVHADDLGLAHSVNQATFKGLESGLVTSASVMVPCPWLEEVSLYAKQNPDADIGIHLTLNSEWHTYKWGPLLGREKVPSLVDARGYLFPSVQETVTKAKPDEVELELRSQIQRAIELGIKPTHLDTHMGTILYSPQFFEIYMKLGREFGLPVLLVKAAMAMAPYAKEMISPEDIVVDHFLMMQAGVEPGQWPEAYGRMVENLKPGVTQLIVHLGFDDSEMQGVAFNHPDFGASWRQRDFDFCTSQRFSDLLKRHNVKLVTWRELGQLKGK